MSEMSKTLGTIREIHIRASLVNYSEDRAVQAHAVVSIESKEYSMFLETIPIRSKYMVGDRITCYRGSKSEYKVGDTINCYGYNEKYFSKVSMAIRSDLRCVGYLNVAVILSTMSILIICMYIFKMMK